MNGAGSWAGWSILITYLLTHICDVFTGCSRPVNVANADFCCGDSWSTYDTVTYTCHVGFSHTDGDLTRTCKWFIVNYWNKEEPVCTCKSVHPNLIYYFIAIYYSRNTTYNL